MLHSILAPDRNREEGEPVPMAIISSHTTAAEREGAQTPSALLPLVDAEPDGQGGDFCTTPRAQDPA